LSSYSLPIHPKATCTSTTQLKQQINPFFTRDTEKRKLIVLFASDIKSKMDPNKLFKNLTWADLKIIDELKPV